MPEIFFLNNEKAKGFCFVPACIFMMDLVCPSNSPQVCIVGIPEKADALMNEHIMNQEIYKAVCCHCETCNRHCMVTVLQSEVYKQEAGERKNEREPVVMLQAPFCIHMMILVELPQKAVHNVLVSEPGYQLHQQEEKNKKKYVKQDLHFTNLQSKEHYKKQELDNV